jgi:putative transposase
MTQPRRIVPGAYYLITRRVLLRTFLLTPGAIVNSVFEYCLAEAAERHNIDVIAWLAMSNHYHAVVCDPDGKLPAFLERFHRMVSRVLNIHHGRREAFWSLEETCVTRLVTLDDVLDKVVYVLTNPVAANLVESVESWPGSSSWNRMDADPTLVTRPGLYFREDGVMQRSLMLRVVPPRDLEQREASLWGQRVRDAVTLRERVLTGEHKAAGKTVFGASAVLQNDVFAAPTTEEPRRKLRPCLACKDAEKMKKARAELRGFRVHYRRMFLLLSNDEQRRLFKDKEELARAKPVIEFPPGTYRLRVVFGVPCERIAA